MDIKKTGELIHRCRKNLGYTQDEFGDKLGVSAQAVSKWERGLSLPDVTLINKIAVTLKISVTQLLSGNVEDISISSNARSHDDSEENFMISSPYVVNCDAEADYGIVSPYIYGNNLEHTRSCICGGLSAQMLKNRKFVGKPSAMEGIASEWFAVGKRTVWTSVYASRLGALPYAQIVGMQFSKRFVL